MKAFLLLAFCAVAGLAAADDSAALKLTHYCVMQNQPRMKLVSSGNTLKFQFEGGTNCSADGMYMGNAMFNLESKDHLKTRWGMISGGKETGHIDMDLKREK